MRKIIVFCVLFLISTYFVKAIVISQVLFDPINTENGGEAIEVYNENDFDIDISRWYISTERSEKDFVFPENTLIKAKNYFLITDKNWSNLKDSALWRNGDFEETITLKNKNSGLMLKNDEENIIDVLNWTKVREGNSLLRINRTGNYFIDFVESIPQFFPENTVSLLVNVNKPETFIDVVLFLDNAEFNNTIINPKNKPQELMLRISSDQKPDVYFLNKTVNVVKSNQYYIAKVMLDNNISPGEHLINLKSGEKEKNITINFGSLATFEVDAKKLSFDIVPGEEVVAKLKIRNTGNVDINISISSTDLVFENNIIPVENFQVTNLDNLDLEDKKIIPVSRGEIIDFTAKILVPENIKPGNYFGLLTFNIEK